MKECGNCDYFSNLIQKVNDLKTTFDPTYVEVTCVTLPKDHFHPSTLKICQSMWIQWSFFCKKLEPKVIDPIWPLTPSLLRSNVWLYPRIIVSKSHGDASMYVDTVINFAKYHIHTTYILHTTYTRYILRTEWVIT